MAGEAQDEPVGVGRRHRQLPARQAEPPGSSSGDPGGVLARQHRRDARRAWSASASATSGSAWPAIAPVSPRQKSTYSMPSTSVNRAPVAVVEEERERAGPAGHPRHRHAAEQMARPSAGHRLRTRMQFDESLEFVAHLARPVALVRSRADGSLDQMSAQVLSEAARRRTFAIISHPDAGKTTLTEKFLLYAGAVQDGRCRARPAAGGRSATSATGWSSSRQRGISITLDRAAVPVPRPRRSTCSTRPATATSREDTYRVLAAVDAVVMVLDAAKGIEPQTLKLFEVCRSPQPAGASRSSTSSTGPAASRSSCSTRSRRRSACGPRRPRGRSASAATSAA